MTSLLLSLLLLAALTPSLTAQRRPFFCIRCEDCSHNNYAPEPCPRNVHGCVTMRISRTEVIRDCYTQERIEQGCDIAHMANKTCTFCDHEPGCNGLRPDAIVCRACDWTTSGTCAVQRVCRAPFTTESPRCAILHRYPFGFHFGCFDDMSKTIESLMALDPYRVTHHTCDSNDCNAHAKDFWPHWQGLQDPFRTCHVCFKDSTFCGPKVCPTDHVYGRYCIRTYDKQLISTCMADEVVKGMHIRNPYKYICSADHCTVGHVAVRHQCNRDYRRNEDVYDPRDGCAMYRAPNGTYLVMGRQSTTPCLDGLRCLICRSKDCQTLIKQEKRLVCYHTQGPEGFYVRLGQVDYMDMCPDEGDMCSMEINKDGIITRGCASGVRVAERQLLCYSHLCNRQLAGIYCYTCQRTDPNCVFSQHEGPFEMCLPPHLGCFTRTFEDNSVERGCAMERTDTQTLSSTYHFCDHAGLCNAESTKRHSCNFLQLNVAFRPPTHVPDEFWQWPTEMGWMFESCRDVASLPACYLKVSNKHRVYGCTSDLADYELTSYQTGSLFLDLNFCDGHYCNLLPDIKDPRRRKLP